MNPHNLTLGTNARMTADAGLEQSIHTNGILIPICVYRRGEDLVVLDGHRRLAAALKLGLDDVPTVEVPAPDTATHTAQQIVINQDRRGLSVLEIAAAYKALKEQGWSQSKIAQTFSVSTAEVSVALATLEAHPVLLQALHDGKLSPSAVEPLLPLSLEDQERLAPAAIAARTVRKVRDVVLADKRAHSTQVVPDIALEEDDTDPLAVLAVQTLEEAATMVQAVAIDLELAGPLYERGRKSVRQLLMAAQRINEKLGGA